MLKRIEITPTGSAEATPLAEPGSTPRGLDLATLMPSMDGMRADLESLSSQLSNTTERIHSIAFCGVDSGVGVSSIAFTVANQLAELHPGQVLLLDVNSRSTRASMLESLSQADSFIQYQAGGDPDNITTTPTLHMLSARGDRRTLGRIKASDLSRTLEQLKERYRWIIIDTPPVMHPETLIWCTCADGCILIVESGRTRRQSAQAVTEQLQGLKANLLGCVLNRRKLVIPERLYRYLFKKSR